MIDVENVAWERCYSCGHRSLGWLPGDPNYICPTCDVGEWSMSNALILRTDVEQDILHWRASFALYDRAVARATEAWHNAHPEEDELNIFPDTAEALFLWMEEKLGEIEELKKRVQELERNPRTGLGMTK